MANLGGNLGMLDSLSLLSSLLQMANYEMSVEDASNSQILAELHKQDRLYFDKIISNQDLIISELKEIKALIQNGSIAQPVEH